ncbi:hypothetical protein [Thermococcus sp. JCM 11816]
MPTSKLRDLGGVDYMIVLHAPPGRDGEYGQMPMSGYHSALGGWLGR